MQLSKEEKSAAKTPRAKRSTFTGCYVYIYFRPCGTPLYVGIAKREIRAEMHQKQETNRYLWRVLQKAKAEGEECPLVRFREGLTWAEAQETEIALISTIGRRDLKTGPLVNMTGGGDGALATIKSEKALQALRDRKGWKMTEDQRARVSASARNRTYTPEGLARLDAAKRRPKGPLSEEHKAKLRKPKSEEWKAKIAAGHRGKPLSEEHRAALSVAGKRRVASEASKAKLRAFLTGRPSPKKGKTYRKAAP